MVSIDEQPHGKTVVLMDVPSEIEATLVVNALAEHGIQATTTGALTSGFRAEVPSEVHILVHESNVEAARAIIMKIEGGAERLPEV